MPSGASAEFTGRCSIFDSFTPIHASMQGVPDGIVSGPVCVPMGFQIARFLLHSNSQAESWSSWRKEAGLQPILPIRASPAVFKASSTAASPGLASTRRLAKTCTWLDLGLPRPSRLVRRSWPLARETSLSVALSPPTITTCSFQKQLQAVWPSLTFELASAVAWRSCFEAASAKESLHICSGEQLRGAFLPPGTLAQDPAHCHWPQCSCWHRHALQWPLRPLFLFRAGQARPSS